MNAILDASQLDKDIPEASSLDKSMPTQSELKKRIPKSSKLNKELPKDVNPENCIELQGTTIEIKPTKLKYFRNHMAAIYNVLKVVPLNEFLSYEKGVFDEERSSDQILFDFLVSVFDNSAIVRDNYDNMDSDDIERILKIFGRINHIDEKEEARKNKEAQAKH